MFVSTPKLWCVFQITQDDATNHLRSQTPGRLRQPRPVLMASPNKNIWKCEEGQSEKESESISVQQCAQKGICQKHSEIGQGKTQLRERRETQDRTPPRLWHSAWREGCQAFLPERNARVTHKRHVSANQPTDLGHATDKDRSRSRRSDA